MYMQNCHILQMNFNRELLKTLKFLKDFGPPTTFKIQYFHFWGLNQNSGRLKVLF